MWYGVLADILVALHLGLATFIVAGQVLILVGLWRRWGWVRAPWFRLAHLAAIAIVGAEAVWGIACPLTVWEDELRQAAGQTVTEGTFIGRCVHSLLFYNVDPGYLNAAHIAFAVLVLGTFIFAPPRWRWGAVGSPPIRPPSGDGPDVSGVTGGLSAETGATGGLPARGDGMQPGSPTPGAGGGADGTVAPSGLGR